VCNKYARFNLLPWNHGCHWIINHYNIPYYTSKSRHTQNIWLHISPVDKTHSAAISWYVSLNSFGTFRCSEPPDGGSIIIFVLDNPFHITRLSSTRLFASVKRFVSLQFLNLGHSVGLLGRGTSPSQGRYLTQTQNKHTHKHCLERDSKSRSQRPSERRQFMP
jgi:hypothetical protein